MKILTLTSLLFFSFCGRSKHSSELPINEDMKEKIFTQLMIITNNNIQPELRNDSLAFLILPIEASCPSCKKKTIDSIISRQNDFEKNHFIILSGYSGQKGMEKYFQERNSDRIPHMQNRIFLDSINHARVLNLYTNKPTMYYTFKGKAYRKVAAIPETVRDDLREFFSGTRHQS